MAGIVFRERKGDVLILSVIGSIKSGIGLGDAIGLEVSKKLKEGGDRIKILLDFEKAHNIDYCGSDELIYGISKVNEAGGQIKVSNVPEKVRNFLVWDRNRYGQLDVYDDKAVVLRSFSGTSPDGKPEPGVPVGP